MIKYYISDIHRDINAIVKWIQDISFSCTNKHNAHTEYLAVLGDSGLNYYLDERDRAIKRILQDEILKLKEKTGIHLQILFVRGNHECRVSGLRNYIKKEKFGGKVFIEEEYSDLVFLEDGSFYEIGGENYLVLGGGYSDDYFERILNGYGWWKDEELSEEEMKLIGEKIDRQIPQEVNVLSHMLPAGIIPTQHSAKRTELFLKEILDKHKSKIKFWYAGHYHAEVQVNSQIFIIYNRVYSRLREDKTIW